jgi:hypothetical protein
VRKTLVGCLTLLGEEPRRHTSSVLLKLIARTGLLFREALRVHSIIAPPVMLIERPVR